MRSAFRRLDPTDLAVLRPDREAHVAGVLEVPPRMLVAPLSRRECVAYEVVVRVGDPLAPYRPAREAHRERARQPCSLRAGECVVRVDLERATIAFATEAIFVSSVLEDLGPPGAFAATAAVREYVAHHVRPFPESYVAVERVLPAGYRTAAIGHVVRRADPTAAADYRGLAGVLELTASEACELVVTDDPRVW